MTSIKRFTLALIMLITSHYGFSAEALSTQERIKYAIDNKDNNELQTILSEVEVHTDSLGSFKLLFPLEDPPTPPKAPKRRNAMLPNQLQAALAELVGKDNTYQALLDTVVAHDDGLMDTSQ